MSCCLQGGDRAERTAEAAQAEKKPECRKKNRGESRGRTEKGEYMCASYRKVVQQHLAKTEKKTWGNMNWMWQLARKFLCLAAQGNIDLTCNYLEGDMR